MLNVTITGLTFTDSFSVSTGATPVNATYVATYPSTTTEVTLTGISYNHKFYIVFENTVTKYRVARLINTDSATCDVSLCDATFTIVQIPPPTPSVTVSPSISATLSCTSYKIVNSTKFDQRISYETCPGGSFPQLLITPGNEVTVCAITESVVAGGCTVTIIAACNGASPTPTPTVTPTGSAVVAFTPTPTKTVTITPTRSLAVTSTPTPSLSIQTDCGDYLITYDDGTGFRNQFTAVKFMDCYGVERTMNVYNTLTKAMCILEINGIPQVVFDVDQAYNITITREGSCYSQTS